MNQTKGSILLAAGGTGGHLFPAEALAHELKARGFMVELATDERALKFTGNFPADKIHIITSATLGSKNPLAVAKTFWRLFKGYRQSRAILAKTRPELVMGFGGYPTLPPLYAASRMGIPAMVHEQNAIIGRANRALSSRIKCLAIGFHQVGDSVSVPVIETGNPVRPNVLAAMATPYGARRADDPFNLVVFGGSQGAHFFSLILPQAIGEMDENHRALLKITQQVRAEDMDTLRSAYDRLGIAAELSPFFADMPKIIADAHLVIARGGASSVTELAVIGRPSILIPLPGSLDGDQRANAIAMQKAGGALIKTQSELDGKKLAELIINAMENPEKMVQMAQAAKNTGKADAAKRLADCVEYVISGASLEAYQ